VRLKSRHARDQQYEMNEQTALRLRLRKDCRFDVLFLISTRHEAVNFYLHVASDLFISERNYLA
jgi:hypothetical protein